MSHNRLELSPEQFRALALDAVEQCCDYLASLENRAIFPKTSGNESERLFSGDWPEDPLGAEALAGLRAVAEHSRAQNGRFFGYVLGSGEPVAALGDLFASVLNQNVTAWRSGPAAVTLERTVVGWMGRAIGCAGFGGSLTGGGSSANLMALAMAREAKLPANERGAQPGLFYASTEVHMSIPKALALLGLGRQNLRLIPVDSSWRIRVDELEQAIRSDVAAGRVPIGIVASAGTVNTGAIDPLGEIAGIARRHGAWFHIDGAYGALAAIAAPEKFSGLAEADSLSLDPHKWLYQPVDCGCLLYRDREAAGRAFSHTGAYAQTLNQDPVEGFAFFDESLELSRRFRALKLWLSLRYHGREQFRASIAGDLELARHLAKAIEPSGDFELLAPVELSAVCFRYRPANTVPANLNALNQAVLRRVIARGRVYLSNALLREQFALRACIVNHRTTQADVDEVLPEIRVAARDSQ